MIASFALVLLMQTADVQEGQKLFAVHCSSCHGINLQGTSQGPPLIDVDAVDVDFMLGTGRMPAAVPFEQEMHKTPLFTAHQIQALVSYVMSHSRGDKSLPKVQLSFSSGVLQKGRDVYVENCEQCHGATAHGDSVGYQDVAPELMESTPREIAEAVRMGPDVMPKFGPEIISNDNLNDLVAYVQFLKHGQYNPGGLQLDNFGPVPEGFVAWTFGLGLLVLLARRIGSTD